MPDPDGMYTDRERDRQTGAYRRAVVPDIAAFVPRLATSLAAEGDEATTEIVRFDTEMGAEVTPYGAVLLRSGLAASSRIEHLSASARAIATAEAEGSEARHAAEIVANTHTMQAAIGAAGDLNGATIPRRSPDPHAVAPARHRGTVAGPAGVDRAGRRWTPDG